MTTPDERPRSRPDAKGFSTRAIRAASRAPKVDQTPTSVPIYQTATFASSDADELGRVVGDGHAGYAYSRISNPTTSALGSAYAELAGGEAGVALASGMAAIHAALASLVRAGDRIVAPLATYGSTRAQLLRNFGGFGVQVDLVDTTDLDAVAAALDAGTVWINTYRAVSYLSPFGGYKRSGLGRESGQEMIKEYLQVKSVWISTATDVPNPFIQR